MKDEELLEFLKLPLINYTLPIIQLSHMILVGFNLYETLYKGAEFSYLLLGILIFNTFALIATYRYKKHLEKVVAKANQEKQRNPSKKESEDPQESVVLYYKFMRGFLPILEAMLIALVAYNLLEVYRFNTPVDWWSISMLILVSLMMLVTSRTKKEEKVG